MKTILERWSISYKELRNEAESLFYLDLCNKTRYKRRKKQEGLLELASREAHEKKMIYYATILEDDDTPYCAIESSNGYFGVDFLRQDLENYLIYVYRDEHKPGEKLFLKQIILSVFKPGTEERDRRVDFLFLPDGSWGTIRYEGEAYNGTYKEHREEHAPLFKEEVELLWVDYPEFGKYEQLIRLDRIPKPVLDAILEVTDVDFSRFREHLERDRAKYQSKE